MSENHQVTVKDVARIAGVSPGTVSNALSGKRPVSEATRQRVLDAIAELDYQPNLLARGLVSRQTGTLAVVATGLQYYGPSRTLVGIEEQATELGFSLLLDLLPRIGSSESEIDGVLRMLTARRVDGIVWAVHEVTANRDWVTASRLQELPPVVFLTMESRPGLSIVSTDNRQAAVLATDHLLQVGRRKIGLITGPLNWWEARERRAGWRESLDRASRPHDDTLVVEGDWSARSGERALHELLVRHPDLDAIFACNDQMALGVLRAAHLREIELPTDLAVVGIDNIPESAYFWPSLTTVRQHLMDVGRRSVQLLNAMVADRQQEEPTYTPVVEYLTPELIVRESCGMQM